MTGEHKIKASAMRREFGRTQLAIGSLSSGSGTFRYAQGVRSKEFHFESRVCAKCNNEITQVADREFDTFHAIVKEIAVSGSLLSEAFNNARYKNNPRKLLNVLRYFAKLLCCHMGDVEGPRSIPLARFALGEVDEHRIGLELREDIAFQNLSREINDLSYTSHGGLIIYSNKNGVPITAIHSTRTIGQVQYVFNWRFLDDEIEEIEKFHGDFYQKCLVASSVARQSPMTEEEKAIYGLNDKSI